MTDLSPYEGRDVAQATIRVTNAGDGLSQALAIKPVEYHHGETVHVVLECEVTNVDYPILKDTDLLARRHTLRAGVSTIVDEKLVKKVLEAQRKAIEEAKGIQELPLDGDGLEDEE